MPFKAVYSPVVELLLKKRCEVWMKPKYTKKKPKRPKTAYEKQKENTWKACSRYNRRKNADKEGMVRCVSCSAKKHWKEQQCGHFLDGRGNAILFEDSGLHAQCLRCNFFGGGTTINVKENYREHMIETYGQEEIDRLIQLKNSARKFTIEELAEMEDNYNDLLVGLDMMGIG